MSDQQVFPAEKWLREQAHGVQSHLGWAIAAAGAAGVLVLLQAKLLALACHQLVIEKLSLSQVLPLVLYVTGIVCVRGWLVYSAECRTAAAATIVKHDVRSRLYRRLLVLGPAGRVAEVGSLVEAVTAGIEALEPYLVKFIPQLVLAMVLPSVAIMLVLPVEWRAGLVLLFSAPFIPLFMILIGRGSEALNRRQWGTLGRMAGHLLDLVQGLPDLRICSAAKREAEVVARVSEEYRRSTMGILRVAFLSAFTLEFFATVGTAVVAVVIGFRLLNGSLTLLDGLFVLLLAPEFYLPLRTLGLSYHARMQGLAAAEKIAPLLSDIIPDEDPFKQNIPAGTPTIHFEQVTFRYGHSRGGVSGIDLVLPSGSVTALVGESGAGKTTLARLLVGLAKPDTGRVLINGVALTETTGAAWRARIAWVPQQPFFFSGTVRDNLLLGCPAASDHAIHAALDAAAARQFVSAMAAGLDTRLGDRGAGLSGGELRRMAMARALLRSADLIVLDEPTAGLDATTERLVTAAIQRLAVKRTVLIISHREATIAGAERVVTMAGGQITQVMTPEQCGAGEMSWAN